MGSSRLPGKVLKPLGTISVLLWVIKAAQDAVGVNEVVVATTTEPADDAIVAYLQQPEVRFKHRAKVFRGSEKDVLSRFHGAAVEHDADLICRITGDCPFIDPAVLGCLVRLQEETGADYVSNIHPPSWPDGLDCEIFTRHALEQAHINATRPIDRDTVTQWITRNRHTFSSATLVCPIPGLLAERWVLDTEADYAFCRAIADRLVIPGGSYIDILSILHREPSLRDINRDGIRNERFFADLAQEEAFDRAS